MESIERIVDRDVAAINTTFRDLRVRARVAADGGVRVCGGSFIAYTLEIKPGVSVKDVQARADDIRYAIRQARGRNGTGVRLRDDMVVEVDHPMPVPLEYTRAGLALPPSTMLVGRDYSERPAMDNLVDLADIPHVLVAGISGSGKSTLMRSLLSTLALNTSPADLVIYLIDLKMDDLLEFRCLPHVATFAGKREQAQRVVRDVMRIVDERSKPDVRVTGPRVLLAIDELAQLDDYDALVDVLMLGRSKMVNVLAATQKPTAKLIGDKANYTIRLVGRVADANEAATATGRAKSGAEMLPGRGAFLRIDGGDTRRIQVYNFNTAAVETVVDDAVARWRITRSPVITGDQEAFLVENWPKMRQNTGSPVITGDRSPLERAAEVLVENTVTFPIKGGREFTAAETAAVRAMHQGGDSLTAICERVYGGAKNKERMDRIKRATGVYGSEGDS